MVNQILLFFSSRHQPVNSEFDVKDDTTTMLKIGQKDRYQITNEVKRSFYFFAFDTSQLDSFHRLAYLGSFGN